VVQGSISVTFTVVFPTVTLTPSPATTGTLITVTGSGFSASDPVVTYYVISAAPHDVLWDGSATRSCTLAGGSITGCSFTVKSNAIGGTYTLRFTSAGTPPGELDTLFIVESSFALNPDSGARGFSGTISGSGYQASTPDCSAAIVGTPSPTFSAVTCAISTSGLLTGTYTVHLTAAFGPHTATIPEAPWCRDQSRSHSL